MKTGEAMESCGISYELTRKKMRNIRITIHPDGRVAVSAPYSAPEALISEFVASKREWILRHVKQAEEKLQANTAPDGSQLVLFGKAYPMIVTEGSTMTLRVTENAAELTVLPGTEMHKIDAFIEAWRRDALKSKLTELVPLWESRTGLYCREWRIKKMKTRWGTCNTAEKRVWFSLMLSEKPLRCIEYVILHELLHLKIPNHGAEFKAASDRYMPNWRMIKKSMTEPPIQINGDAYD